MRIVSVILMSAVVGTAVGAAVAYFEVRSSEGALASSGTPSAATAPPPGASEPRVEVDELKYDFGAMQRGTTKSHEFVFRNVGHGPLTLRVGGTSCKCTVGDVPGDALPPGASVPVRLEWRALVAPGPFRQTASILTNDPQLSRIELSVEGNVTEASGVTPPDFMFDKVAAGETKSAEVFVMALVQDDLEVGEPMLSNAETRKFFDVSIEPVDRSDLPNPNAKKGVRVTVTVKPGLSMGRFDQALSLRTNIPDAEKLEIPIIGRVIGNITVHGRYWNEDQGVLRIGRVKSDEGATAPLNIVIHGEGADAVTLSVASCDPPELIAKLGEPKRLKPTLVHVPLTIDIPPGTPPMARLDTQQNDEGRVVIKTTNTKIPEMVIGVQFAVER